MFSTEQLQTYTLWSGYLTLFCAGLAVLAWLFQWGIRFRLVGVTGFMGVLTGGLFALSLGFYSRPVVPDAVKFSRVFDTGGTNVVIAVAPEINETQLRATLEQAALDLYSSGRLSQGAGKMTIRLRTVLHAEPGISKLLYLGQVKRSLLSRQDAQLDIEIYPDKLAQLSKPLA